MGPVRQNPIQRTVRCVHICVHCTVHNNVAHDIAQNKPDNPPDNHHCSDDVCLREGGKQQRDSQSKFPPNLARWRRRRRKQVKQFSHPLHLKSLVFWRCPDPRIPLYILWPPCIAGCGQSSSCFFLYFYLFSAPYFSGRRLDVYQTSTHDVVLLPINAGLKICCARLATNTGPKKSPKSRHMATIAQLCRAIPSQLRHLSTIGNNVLNSNVFPRCPHNMANFGPLASEISWRVWGTPANFNRFRVLAALLYGTLV